MDFTGFQRVPNTDKPIYSLDMKQLNPLFQLIKRIKLLEELDLEIIGYKKILYAIRSLFQSIDLNLQCTYLPETIYRGIKYKQDISNKSEIWYCPDKEKIPRGRVNKPKEQIFYGAMNFESVIYELEPDDDQIVNICRCKLKKTETGTITLIGLSEEALIGIKAPKELEKQINSFFNIFKSNLLINDFPISNLSDELVIQIFIHKYMSLKSNKTSFYKVTNAICEIIFESMEIGGIAYPNINSFIDDKHIMTGWNYALKSEIIDDLYELTDIWKIKKIKQDNNKSTIGFIDYSNQFSINDEILWEDFQISNLPEINGRIIGETVL
jgi:hypothetical protein